MLIHGGIDEQRPLCDLRRRRLVLDELQQLVLEDDLARRGRDVDAELEGFRIGHRNLEATVTALDVVEQIVEPLDEVLTAGRDRLAEHLGVGQREIRRRKRVDVLAREEVDLLLRRLVEAFDVADRVVKPARGDEVALLDVVEQEVLFPVLVAEPLVALRRFDDGVGRAAEKLRRRRLPQAHVLPPQVHLRFGHPVRVRHHLGGELHEGLADSQLIGDERWNGAGLARREFPDHLGALLRGGAQRLGERDGVVRRFRDGVFHGGLGG